MTIPPGRGGRLSENTLVLGFEEVQASRRDFEICAHWICAHWKCRANTATSLPGRQTPVPEPEEQLLFRRKQRGRQLCLKSLIWNS